MPLFIACASWYLLSHYFLLHLYDLVCVGTNALPVSWLHLKLVEGKRSTPAAVNFLVLPKAKSHLSKVWGFDALKGMRCISSQMKDLHLLEKPSRASLQSKSSSALPCNVLEKPSVCFHETHLLSAQIHTGITLLGEIVWPWLKRARHDVIAGLTSYISKIQGLKWTQQWIRIRILTSSSRTADRLYVLTIWC